MRLLIIGATGEIGRRVAELALRHFPAGAVTLFVRSKEKLKALLPEDLLNNGERLAEASQKEAASQVVEADVRDAVALKEAMRTCGACICTAGNAKADATDFQTIFAGVVDAAVDSLAEPKRLWMLAGATVTDVAGIEDLTINDLPIFNLLPFRVHTLNHHYLLAKAASLDWTLMCPGVLHPMAGEEPNAQLFVAAAPLFLPAALKWQYAPKALLSLAVLAQMQRFGVSLEEVAQAMLDRLEPDPELRHKRVGLIK